MEGADGCGGSPSKGSDDGLVITHISTYVLRCQYAHRRREIK